jgi:hypothetical protein
VDARYVKIAMELGLKEQLKLRYVVAVKQTPLQTKHSVFLLSVLVKNMAALAMTFPTVFVFNVKIFMVQEPRKMTDRAFVLQKSAGKLPCMSSVDFFKSTGQRLIQSIWNDRETLLVLMLSNYLRSTAHRVSVQTLTELYNINASENAAIRNKSPHQVLNKIRHIDRRRSICNR